MILSLLILIPVIVSVAILVAPVRVVRYIALFGAAVQLLYAVFVLHTYSGLRDAGDEHRMLFEYFIGLFNQPMIAYNVAVDGISLAMVLLTAVVVLAGVLVSWKVEKMAKEYFFLLTLLSIGAYGFFISVDLFMMFFFLELAVIPKFLLIAIWGSGRKEYSANKLALMLMGGSALIFVGLLSLYYYNADISGFSLLSLAYNPIPVDLQIKFFPLLFLGFGVFGAMFPFHTWVPDGHSSAPTAASMFLAGISMKLGGYGCLRVATYLMPAGAHEYQTVIIALSAIGILYGAFATMMQTDLKYINAYSSVSHCGFVLLGIGTLTQTGINGAVMQMVSHGLMTALFFAAIGMLYERTHTRMVAEMSGILKITPFIGTVFFIAGLCSLGLPGFSGFVAEMTVFMGAWQNADTFYRIATIAACASIVVTAVYILRALGKVMMGPLQVEHGLNFGDAAWNEKLAAIVLIAGILLIGVAPFGLQQLIKPDSQIIIEHLTRAAF